MKFPRFSSVEEIKLHLKVIGLKISSKDLLTDGCSLSPDFQFKSCCKIHDFWYTTGLISREEADLRLRDCIRKKSNWLVGQIYYRAVRWGGASRWDYLRKFELERDYEWSQSAVELEIIKNIGNTDDAFDLMDQLRFRHQERESKKDRADSSKDSSHDS